MKHERTLKPLTPLENKIYKVIKIKESIFNPGDLMCHRSLKNHSKNTIHGALSRLLLKGYVIPPAPFKPSAASLSTKTKILNAPPINHDVIDKVYKAALENGFTLKEAERLRRDLGRRAV